MFGMGALAVQFTGTGQVCGARLHHYLLEKARVSARRQQGLPDCRAPCCVACLLDAV
jgi:hypothetical protein